LVRPLRCPSALPRPLPGASPTSATSARARPSSRWRARAAIRGSRSRPRTLAPRSTSCRWTVAHQPAEDKCPGQTFA